MSTNPQSPQGSPSEARGSQSHPHPVAEGRQSPGPMHEITFAVSRQGSAILISAPKEIADGMDGDHLEDNCFKGIPKEPGTYIASVEFVFHQGYFEGYPAAGESDWEYIIHSFRPLAAPGAPQGGDGPSPSARLFRDLEAGEIIGPNDECWAYGCGPWMPAPDAIGQKYIPENGVPFRRLVSLEAPSSAPLSAAKGPDLPPQSSQEEGPAGVDLEADLQAIEEFMKRAGLFGDEKIRNHVKARAEEAVHRLRAQAPASSPRDLEAARKSIDVIIGCYEDMAFHAGKEGFNEAQRSYEIARDAVEKKLAAHPPKGETPSEAAGLPEVFEDYDSAMAQYERTAEGAARTNAWERVREERGKLADRLLSAQAPKVHVTLESGAKPETVAALGAAIAGAIKVAQAEASAPGTPIEKAAREYVEARRKAGAVRFGPGNVEDAYDADAAEDAAFKVLEATLSSLPPGAQGRRSAVNDYEIIHAALKAGKVRGIKREAHLFSDAFMALARLQLAAPQAQEETRGAPAAPWAEYTKVPVPDLNHVYWLVWAARHMVAVCAGRDADIATVSDQAKLLGVLLAKHFADIPGVVGSKAITPAEPEAGSPAAGESQGAKLPNLEQLSPAEHRNLLRRAGTQEGGSQP